MQLLSITTIYGGLFLIVLLIIWYMIHEHNTKQTQIYTREKRLKQLQSKIDQKVIELYNLNDQVEKRKLVDNVNLTQQEIDVLDWYANSNIRIPIDIIEDLHFMRLDDESEIHKYIESQRHYWKLENTKKVYKVRS